MCSRVLVGKNSVLTGTRGYSWVPVGTRGYPWVPVGTREHSFAYVMLYVLQVSTEYCPLRNLYIVLLLACTSIAHNYWIYLALYIIFPINI